MPLKGGTSYEKNDILNYMEHKIDTGFELQCKLSRCTKVMEFMKRVFFKFVQLFYSGLYVYAQKKGFVENLQQIVVNTIASYFEPEEKGQSSNKKFILKPGIHDARVLIKLIIESTDMTEQIEREFMKYSMSELMGSLYLFCTKSLAYDILLQAYLISLETDSPSKQHMFLRDNLKNVFDLKEVLDNYFGLNGEFTLKDLAELDVEVKVRLDNNKFIIQETDKRLLLSLMVNNTLSNESDTKLITIPRVGDLNNKDFVRKRKDRPTSNEYQYNNIIPMPSCPRFYSHKNRESRRITDQTFMVKGDEWYNLTTDGFFKKIMDQHGRTSLAGPSGSTVMWIVFVFGLLRFDKKDHETCRRFLCCVICDFVPIYHTLSEVLIVFSRELAPKKPYYINDSPLKWLYSYLLQENIPDQVHALETKYEQITNKYLGCIDIVLKNRNMPRDTVGSIQDFVKSCKTFIGKTCDDQDGSVWKKIRLQSIKKFIGKLIDIQKATKNLTVPEYFKMLDKEYVDVKERMLKTSPSASEALRETILKKYDATSKSKDGAFWNMDKQRMDNLAKLTEDDFFVQNDEWPIMKIFILYHECLDCFVQFDDRIALCALTQNNMLSSLCSRESLDKKQGASKSFYSKLASSLSYKRTMSASSRNKTTSSRFPSKSISVLKTPGYKISTVSKK